MKCIFCKNEANDSKSVEHIIPQTLGNTTMILPKGFVCDECNNYFSRKIESPFFEMEEIKRLRFFEGIPNKRGKIPPIEAMLNGNKVFAERIYSENEQTNNQEIKTIRVNPKEGILLIPSYKDCNLLNRSRIISRFIAKIAYESLVYKFYDDSDWLNYIFNNNEFNGIRNYVRFNTGDLWPYSVRRIYDIDSSHSFYEGEHYQIVHESDFLILKEKDYLDEDGNEMYMAHLYFIVSLWGLEFVINLADRSEDSLFKYEQWLKEHDNISYLHYGKNDTSVLCKGEKNE